MCSLLYILLYMLLLNSDQAAKRANVTHIVGMG